MRQRRGSDPDAIRVIDLFAGPGGLGEGFSSLVDSAERRQFKIALSIEKDAVAHQTLELRAFFRQFPRGLEPNEYYDYLRGTITRGELLSACPKQAQAAADEAWNATLGEVSPGAVDDRIEAALGHDPNWVLIGGPPCQAYSLAGRSRVGGIDPADHRVYLYREYLRILARHAPPVFVMENVKGLLSSRVGGEDVFEWIRQDLEDPAASMRRRNGRCPHLKDYRYRLRSLVSRPQRDLTGEELFDANDFVIRSERYGIPQARHRVIIVGIRDDVSDARVDPLIEVPAITLVDAIGGLPKLRSGLSKETDDQDLWRRRVREFFQSVSARSVRQRAGEAVLERLQMALGAIESAKSFADGRGAPFIECKIKNCFQPEWFCSGRLRGLCNHETRGHIVPDLHRYLYAACFAEVIGRTPDLSEFPDELVPDHRSADAALDGKGGFADRFRVQPGNRFATTITSHISKDGHYYIHYDPLQCRSLTVREAARIQTFPDDYFFEGPRTEQYRQVGNAVPPLMAREIARIIHRGFLRQRTSSSRT